MNSLDVQLLVSKEEVPPEQQELRPTMDQEDPPEPTHIKDEQEELWTSQEGEQIRGLEEAEIIKSPFTPVPMKSEEDDEEKPQSSQLHQRLTDQMETKTNGDDCGGPEPARNSDPDGHFQPEVDDKMSHSESKTDDSCDWEETREPQSGSNPLQSNEVPLQEHNGLQTPELPHIKENWSPSMDQVDPPEPPLIKEKRSPSLDQEDSPEPPLIKEKRSPSLDQEDPPEPTLIKDKQEELWTSQEGKQLQEHQRLTEHMETKTDGEDCGGPEPARNSDPDGHFQPAVDDKMSHSEPKTDDSCDWEETREPQSGSKPSQNNEVPVSDQECSTVKTPSSSSECATSSGHKPNEVPVSDQECSTVKTPSSSSECATSSGHKPQTEEKPFRCSVCGKTYVLENTLKKHMRLHSETQFYRCSICNQTFITESSVSIHERSHTVENPFSCSVCGKGFTLKQELRRHMKAGLHLTVVS